MNEGENIDEQAPGHLSRRIPECRCTAPAHGGCRCYDDGTLSHGGGPAERAEPEQP